MAVITINSATTGLTFEAHWKHWGKLAQTGAHVDLNQKNGYSLTGPFVRWGEAIALNPGEYVVAASETGSRRYHGYDYALLTVDEAGGVVVVDPDEIGREATTDERLSERARANAKNSALYAIAAYLRLRLPLSAPAPAVPAASVERVAAALAALEAARVAVEALTTEERPQVLEAVHGLRRALAGE